MMNCPQFSILNHQPSHHISAHPIHHTLSTEDIATITSFIKAGIRPKQIRTYLRENSTSIATQQDIYNMHGPALPGLRKHAQTTFTDVIQGTDVIRMAIGTVVGDCNPNKPYVAPYLLVLNIPHASGWSL
jgi:hypothetical protein